MASKYRDSPLTLSIFSVAYNLVEGLVSVGFAALAGSPALLGFGIDSFVESLSGLVMIWRFSHPVHGAARERTAIRLVGLSLVLLAAYVVYEAASALAYNESPDRSVAGLVIAVVSLATMPPLYLLKRRAAKAVQSHSLAADAKQTLACIMLSIALLVGSGMHYIFGLWQADPIAGLVIAAFLAREGYKAWTEREFCC